MGKSPISLAEKYIPTVLQYVLEYPPLPGSFFNVNFPHAVIDEVKGFRMTRQGKGRWIEDPILHLESTSGPSYWLGGKPEEISEFEDSDISLLRQGYMTAVPIHIHELTDFEEINKRKEHFESYFLSRNGKKNEKRVVENSLKD